MLRAASSSALKARTVLLTQISSLLIKKPDDLRAKYREQTRATRLKAMAAGRPAGGPTVASQLLVTIGDNPERLTSEAQFAVLTRVASIPASSGKTTCHRLSRDGDRNANAATHRIALVRMATDRPNSAAIWPSVHRTRVLAR